METDPLSDQLHGKWMCGKGQVQEADAESLSLSWRGVRAVVCKGTADYGGRMSVVKSISGKDLLIRDLKKKILELEAENRQLHNELDRALSERDYASYCLDETRKSFSYKLGHFLTAIPRKFRTL